MTKIPDSLYECVQWMMKNVEGIDQALKETESSFVAKSHQGVGQYIRNNWGLWKEDSPLYFWFVSLGIYHPDDMSAIIIRTTWRKHHKKDIDLNGMVQNALDYWANLEKEQGIKLWPKEDNT